MSDDKQETIEDIVREMRTLGRLDEQSTDKIPRSLQALGLRTYADRIEAAATREREAGADEICDLRECHVNPALSAPKRNCDVLSKDEVLETLKDRSFSKEDTIEWLYGKE